MSALSLVLGVCLQVPSNFLSALDPERSGAPRTEGDTFRTSVCSRALSVTWHQGCYSELCDSPKIKDKIYKNAESGDEGI